MKCFLNVIKLLFSNSWSIEFVGGTKTDYVFISIKSQKAKVQPKKKIISLPVIIKITQWLLNFIILTFFYDSDDH